MKVIVTKQFDKDTEKELNKAMQLKLAVLIEQLQQATSLDNVSDTKNLKDIKQLIVSGWVIIVSDSF